MKVEQFVMAYGIEQDRVRALLPSGFQSLRPVLRINAEVRDGNKGYLEFNTAVNHGDVRGWLNIAYWDDIPFTKEGKKTTFENDRICISFEGVGIEGGCPAEKDNAGCFFDGNLHPAEIIQAKKEFCDCEFQWKLTDGASGKSIGKTLPAIPTECAHDYPKQPLTVEHAATIPCQQVLGTYRVEFERID